MYNFVNFNQLIREMLYTQYKKNSLTTTDEFDVNCQYDQFIEELKLNNYTLYQYTIGLLYIDNYRMLTYRNKNNNLTDDEEKLLERYENIDDLDSLLFELEIDQDLINTFKMSSLKYNFLNSRGKAHIILTDESYTLKFNKFHFFEKENIFKNLTVDDLINIYKKYIIDEKEEAFSFESLHEEALANIVDILDIQLLGNPNNFNKLILTMVKDFYKSMKFLQIKKPYLIFDIEEDIINLIEKKSIDEILKVLTNNYDIILLIVEEYIAYKTNKIDIQGIEDIYINQVSNTVKVKLKEVSF